MHDMKRLAVSVLLVSIALAGCNRTGDGEAKPDAQGAAAAAGADDAGDAEAIPGLPTEKDRVSYMVGMALARQFEPIREELDVDVVVKALKTSLEGGELLMTEEQAQQVGERFESRMRAAQAEKREAHALANAAAGKAFLAENANKPGVKVTGSGLQYQVLEPGNGPKPTAEDTVRVNYVGKLLDGTVFDGNAGQGGPVDFPLGQVVPGWQEGISLMPVGSKYRFWIPPDLAYGDAGTPGGPIPPNATLVFEVELVGIE
jgi:FKBP-type peptidyl-prolyl cis-trans isomerase FkpA/FKBP-type peptidyl-prolyl cis-trans isomerase FklB